MHYKKTLKNFSKKIKDKKLRINTKVLILKKKKKIIFKRLEDHKPGFKLVKNKIFKKKNIFNFKSISKVFKHYIYIFIKKLFNSFIKKGKKMFAINCFLKIMFFIFTKIFKSKERKKNKTKFFLLYFSQILNNIIPISIYTNLMFRGKSILIPWMSKNTKLNKMRTLRICVSWTKKSIYKRKEKTLFFKILSELEDARLNKGETVLNKKNYYLQFYQNKYYIRYLKRRVWT